MCSSVAKRLKIFQRQPFVDEKNIISEEHPNGRDTTADADEYLDHSEGEEDLHNREMGYMADEKYTESSQNEETSRGSTIDQQVLYETDEPWLDDNCSRYYQEIFDESPLEERHSFAQRVEGRDYREQAGCDEENYFSDFEYVEDEDETRIGTLRELARSLTIADILGFSQYLD